MKGKTRSCTVADIFLGHFRNKVALLSAEFKWTKAEIYHKWGDSLSPFSAELHTYSRVDGAYCTDLMNSSTLTADVAGRQHHPRSASQRKSIVPRYRFDVFEQFWSSLFCYSGLVDLEFADLCDPSQSHRVSTCLGVS